MNPYQGLQKGAGVMKPLGLPLLYCYSHHTA